MQHPAVARRALAALAIGIVVLAGSSPGPVVAGDPLESINFAVGDETLFDVPSPGGGYGRTDGTWSLKHGRMANGNLELHLQIDPVRQPLPVRSGPAVLFVGLHLYGDAGGDMGLGQTVPTLVHKVIPACADDVACHYFVDVSIPTDEVPSAIRRLERYGDLIWLSATLTLVRTYGQGQWLEVVPFTSRDSFDGAAAGRLGAIDPAEGQLIRTGLLPAGKAKPIRKGEYNFENGLDYPAIVERLRAKVDDPSTPLPMVDVTLHIRVEPACGFYSELWLHDDAGDQLFHTLAYGKPKIETATVMPVGIPWYLTLSGGGGVAEPAALLGPIMSDGSPVEIFGFFDCEAWSGKLELVGAAAPTSAPSVRPPATAPRTTPPTSAAASPGLAVTSGPGPSSTSATTVPVLLVLAICVVLVVGAAALAASRGSLWRRSG